MLRSFEVRHLGWLICPALTPPLHFLRPMPTRIYPALLRALFVGFLLLLTPRSAWAQAGPVTPHGYDFLTVTTVESSYKKEPYLLFTPAFQGQSVIPLPQSSLYASSPEDIAKLTESTALIDQKLSALTVDGWELVHVNSLVTAANRPMTRYLFRKAKS